MRNSSFNPEPKDEMPAKKEAILACLWAQFNNQFPTEEDCLEEVYKRANDGGMLKCHHCGNKDIERDYGQRTFTCLSCKKTSWFTAGTFFHHMKLARAWLGAIWLMDHGQTISSLRFQKLAGIAYSSALNIFKKLTMVIESEMGEDAIAVSSSFFSPLVGKRSRETPARAHPLAEQEEIEAQVLDNSKEGQESADVGELAPGEKEVYDVLSGEPVHFDVLCQRTGKAASNLSSSLMMLELAGLAKRIAGDRYVRHNPKESEQFYAHAVQSSLRTEDRLEPTRTVSAIINFVRLNFHHIARKYLQNYLAAYWCHMDRRRWQLGALLQACLRFVHISDDEILDYVSPVMVKVVPC